jgi:predicted restriction endonuclease
MQLSNFASLDTYHQNRGISGLRPPGKLAQNLWEEVQSDWENVILESEYLLETLDQSQSKVEALKRSDEKAYRLTQKEQSGPTETKRFVNVRLGQRFFRDSILANYREHCCICAMPIVELLIASHIIPWKGREDLRLNPSNGLCLCALHDKAFDRGLLSIDEDYKVMISSSIHEHSLHEAVKKGLFGYSTCAILLPDRFIPDREFLEIHRNQYFIQ